MSNSPGTPMSKSDRAADLETRVNKAKHAAHVYIGLARIDIQGVLDTKIAEIIVGYEQVVLITEDEKYVVIEAKAYYDSGPYIDHEEHLSINDAYDYGILPDSLYAPLQIAETARDEFYKEQQKARRLREVISENGGPDNVRKILEGDDL